VSRRCGRSFRWALGKKTADALKRATFTDEEEQKIADVSAAARRYGVADIGVHSDVSTRRSSRRAAIGRV
jgi:hypothetical protein